MRCQRESTTTHYLAQRWIGNFPTFVHARKYQRLHHDDQFRQFLIPISHSTHRFKHFFVLCPSENKSIEIN